MNRVESNVTDDEEIELQLLESLDKDDRKSYLLGSCSEQRLRFLVALDAYVLIFSLICLFVSTIAGGQLISYIVVRR